jgi:anti-anti-sigma factor
VREEIEGTVRLKLEGALSIYEAVAIREEFLACFESGSAFEIDLSNVSNCDTAGLQILIAARKTADQRKRDFFINDAPQIVVKTLQDVGLQPDEIISGSGE